MSAAPILIVDGDIAFRRTLKGLLRQHGYAVEEASDDHDVLETFEVHRPALVVLGCHIDSCDGLQLAERIHQEDREVPLVLINEHSCEERAIAALRAGVDDYFKLPVAFEDLVARVGQLVAGIHRPPDRGRGGGDSEQPIIGKSLSMREVKAHLTKIAATDCNVLISGETGTGKELAAKMVHECSPRHRNPMICINCAAVPDGLLESELFGHERGAFTGAHSGYEGKLKLAQGGTVFLDEIGDMSPHAQAKVLRAIESKEVYRLGGRRAVPLDIRVIAASNQGLERLVSENQFRKDLYFRLAVARIHLPPLRERKEDIQLLVNHYIKQLNGRYGCAVEGMSHDALDCLFRYDWPGNVRELKNVLEGIFISAAPGQISAMDLPERFRSLLTEKQSDSVGERELLLSALVSTNWNKSRAAAELRWSRMTLYRKMARFQISKQSCLK